MKIQLIFYTLLASIDSFSYANSGNCDPIRTCSGFEIQRVGADFEPQPTIANWQNESEIAKNGSWLGIVPELYRIQLSFHNRTHYSGSVEIRFKLISPTERIMINHGTKTAVDYAGILIKRDCGRRSSAGADHSATGCIQKATFLEAEQTLILDLNEANLDAGPDSEYVISIPSFRGRSLDEDTYAGALGLRESTVDNQRSGQFSALTTIFQMRYARTVFPSFDHPSLKAEFEVCIERPAHVLAASNTPPLPVESKTIGTNRKRDCFERTPVIPTYLFTFSLMENYTSESQQIPNGGPSIEIFGPIAFMDKYRWMFREAVEVFQYMERVTKFKLPLKRLAFVVAYPAPFWGIENFGLVTVDGGFMQAPESSATAYTILYHEIVHQWLGDMVTISEWREICLQEGLTAYFEWKLSAERRNGSLDNKAQSERRRTDGDYFYQPYALMEYTKTQDIADNCFGRPPFFFHTVTMRYGFATLERFLAKLFQKKPYGTTDLQVWDTTLDEVSGNGQSHPLKGYIAGWFLQPGPLYLLVSRIPNSDCIFIEQKIYGLNRRKPKPTVARPVPVRVQTFGSPPYLLLQAEMTAVKQHVCGIPSEQGQGVLVDGTAMTYTRKAYNADNYRRLLQAQKRDQNAVPADQLENLVQDFCRAFLDNVLPLDAEPATTTASDWLEIYELIKLSKIPISRVCTCCLNSKEVNAEIPRCKFRTWNQYCPNLSLNVAVGRNYTFGRDETKY